MEHVLINNDLELLHPDGFHIMTREELKAAYNLDYDNMWGMRNEQTGVIICVFWKVSSKLLGKIATAKLVSEQAEDALRRRLKKQQYRYYNRYQDEVAGSDAHILCYGYEREGVPQDCRMVTVKNTRCCYTLYYYSPAATADANLRVFEDVMASARFTTTF